MVTGSTAKMIGSKRSRRLSTISFKNRFDITELPLRSASLLHMKEATDALEGHRTQREQAVEDRTVELRRALQQTAAAHQSTYEAHPDTIRGLVLAAEYKDRATVGHMERIGRFCEFTAHGIELPAREVRVIRYASTMHDVGKIGNPDAILLTRSPDAGGVDGHKATHPDRCRHPPWLPSALLQLGEVIPLSHHERWGGSGYPRGDLGEEIPLAGRICAVADVFDALTNERHYCEALPHETVYAMMTVQRGRHFDPHILDAFLDRRREIELIQRELDPMSL